MLLNPEWLLARFVAAAQRHIAQLPAAPPQSALRRNALNYVHELLDEGHEDP